MRKLKIGAALAAVLALGAFAWRQAPVTLCEGFLPENDWRIPVHPFRAQTIEQDMFNRVLDRVEEVYGPIVAAKGKRLKVNRLWASPTVNASATRFWGKWNLNMYGGLARHPAVTEEGFMLVACHELGHHLGGAPKMPGFLIFKLPSSWATIEGGSDYYATLKCMRRMYRGAPVSSPVDPVAEAACVERYADEASRNDCRRSALAGQSVARLFKALRRSGVEPRFDTPNATVVPRMVSSHPETQCRLDTYFQGALCGAPLSRDVARTDVNAGACTAKNGHRIGLRPRCWYKPPPDEPAAAPMGPPPTVRRPAIVSSEELRRRLEALGSTLLGDEI